MKKLILMRHAESQPEQMGLNDRDRCLSGGGMEELELIRRKLQGNLQGLQLVLCSNVKRTRQTLEGIKAILPSNCETAFDDGLYHAPASNLINRLHDIENSQDFVMVIGHNPAVSDFLNAVMSVTQQPGMPRMVPTSGVAIFEGNFTKWQDASPARFTLQSFLVP
ncbi:MAG: histidine phosphatase family protein [Alphaproteobacteria bacterium]|jgi:phosphohistidine phosphatase|nr:histidine phosphatase family protein [Alphaproteobacteria bacterium]